MYMSGACLDLYRIYKEMAKCHIGTNKKVSLSKDVFSTIGRAQFMVISSSSVHSNGIYISRSDKTVGLPTKK